MSQEIKISFSQGIIQYISRALSLWPALQLALSHLQEAVNPPEGSPIKHYNFSSMDRKQFIHTITKDLHDYIQQHDVKQQHILDYLRDVLQILNTEEENQNTMKHMSREMIKLIQQLPDGNITRLLKFREVQKQLKGKKLNHIVENRVHECDSDESCGECEEGSGKGSQDEQMSEEEQEWSEEDNKMEEQVPNLVGQKEKEEQDDGWVIVKTKKSKK